MQTNKHQSWKISVHAKAKNFNFKLNAWKTNGTRFYILTKFHRFFLKMVSETGDFVDSRQSESSKSKILWLFKKLLARKISSKALAGKEKPNTTSPVISKRSSDGLPHEVSSICNMNFSLPVKKKKKEKGRRFFVLWKHLNLM